MPQELVALFLETEEVRLDVAAGAFRGVWDGSMLQIRQVVQISDGTQNFDVIDIDMLKDTFVIKAYTLK